MSETKPIRAGARRCPICGKPADPRHGVFCSARCQTIDLGRWLKGDYRMPSAEAPDGAPSDETEE
jgi:uncharacterized protein